MGGNQWQEAHPGPPPSTRFPNRWRVFGEGKPGSLVSDIKGREVKTSEDERFHDRFADRPLRPRTQRDRSFCKTSSLIIRHKGPIDPLCHADAEQIALCEVAVYHTGASCQAMLVA